jgi:hypothetical protein
MADAPIDADVFRNAVENLHIDGQRITVTVPLLERVYDLNAEITAKFPAGWDTGMGQMGLLLNRRLENEGYWCTPTNSLSFGETGGDGAHFSFLITENKITDKTPVIISVPDNFGDPDDANVVLGRGFEEFVRLGLHCGYFSMAQFAFNNQAALKHYARADWDDADSWFPSGNHRIVAEYVSKKLNLKRLAYSADELAELQSEFKPLMQFKDAG